MRFPQLIWAAVTLLGFGIVAAIPWGIVAALPRALNAPSVDAETAEAIAYELIELTNLERENEGLPPLKRQENLRDAAMWMAEDMALNDYLSHTDSLGREVPERLQFFAYPGSLTGENVARGFDTAALVMDAWMQSVGHRANILRPQFREIGAGYTETTLNPMRWYWVQDFGTQSGVYPVVINREAMTTTSSTVDLYVYGEGWADDVRLSSDGSSWTPWSTYAPEHTWSLPAGNGERTVYAEIRQGVVVRSAADTIIVAASSGTATPSMGTPSMGTPSTGTPTPTAPTPSTTPFTATPTATTTTTPTPTPTSTSGATLATPTTPSPTTPPPSTTSTSTVPASSTPSTTSSPTASPTATASGSTTNTPTFTPTADPTLTVTLTTTATIPTGTITSTSETTATMTAATPIPTGSITQTLTPSPTLTSSPPASITGTPAISATLTTAPATATVVPTDTATTMPSTATEPPATVTSTPSRTVGGSTRRSIFLPVAFTHSS